MCSNTHFLEGGGLESVPNDYIVSTRYLHTAVENISDEEEEEEDDDDDEGPIPELPTLPDTFAAAPAHHRPPHPLSLPARSMKDNEKTEGTSAKVQRRKWASVTSNSFEFSGDEGGTPASAAFGKQSVQCRQQGI